MGKSTRCEVARPLARSRRQGHTIPVRDPVRAVRGEFGDDVTSVGAPSHGEVKRWGRVQACAMFRGLCCKQQGP